MLTSVTEGDIPVRQRTNLAWRSALLCFLCKVCTRRNLDEYLESQFPIYVANCCNFYTLYTSEPAQIIEKAKSLKVTEKDPVTLECTVAGTPELRIRWYKDGKQLLPSRYYTMSFENNVASFRIEPVSKEDSGTYSFKVENDFGSSTCEAVLTVLGLYCQSIRKGMKK